MTRDGWVSASPGSRTSTPEHACPCAPCMLRGGQYLQRAVAKFVVQPGKTHEATRSSLTSMICRGRAVLLDNRHRKTMLNSHLAKLCRLLQEVCRPALTRPAFVNMIVLVVGWIMTVSKTAKSPNRGINPKRSGWPRRSSMYWKNHLPSYSAIPKTLGSH